MAELEAVIEQKLIEQLIYGDSQWIYRNDLKTEEDLWNNFRYILEQNNKERLNGDHLSDSEFEQVKNQLQFSSFYKAGEWLVGENGKVMVLRDLMPGTKRFGELKKSIGSVSQKVLTAQLRDMEEKGLVSRKVYAEVPPRVEYSLTALGKSLKPILDAMWTWGENYKAQNM